MKTQVGRIVILVDDYDEAYSFYHEALGCIKLFDMTTDDGQRYLHLGFNENDSSGIWFLQAEGKAVGRVGNQTEGFPLMVIYTENIDELECRLKDRKVVFKKEKIDAGSFKFLHFLDLYGNEIIVVELKK